jgi:hypothetical protein
MYLLSRMMSYDVMKLRVTLHPRSQKYRRSNQQNRRDNEVREVTI